MRFVLVRHGAVQPPRPKTFYGGTEVPLSDLGRAEAATVAAALRSQWLDHVVCSPLERARFGADLIAAGRGLADAPETVAAFREIDRGRWLGLTLEELRERWPGDWEAHSGDPESWRGHGGESLGDLRRRVLEGSTELSRDWHGRTLAVVAHLYPIRALVAEAQGLSYAAWEAIRIPTGSVSVLETGPKGWSALLVGHRPAEGDGIPGLST